MMVWTQQNPVLRLVASALRFHLQMVGMDNLVIAAQKTLLAVTFDQPVSERVVRILPIPCANSAFVAVFCGTRLRTKSALFVSCTFYCELATALFAVPFFRVSNGDSIGVTTDGAKLAAATFDLAGASVERFAAFTTGCVRLSHTYDSTCGTGLLLEISTILRFLRNGWRLPSPSLHRRPSEN